MSEQKEGQWKLTEQYYKHWKKYVIVFWGFFKKWGFANVTCGCILPVGTVFIDCEGGKKTSSTFFPAGSSVSACSFRLFSGESQLLPWISKGKRQVIRKISSWMFCMLWRPGVFGLGTTSANHLKNNGVLGRGQSHKQPITGLSPAKRSELLKHFQLKPGTSSDSLTPANSLMLPWILLWCAQEDWQGRECRRETTTKVESKGYEMESLATWKSPGCGLISDNKPWRLQWEAMTMWDILLMPNVPLLHQDWVNKVLIC